MRNAKGQFVKGHVSETAWKKGNIPWCLGKKLSREHIDKLRTSHIGIPNASKGIKRPQNSGENHFKWNGGSKTPEYTRKYAKEYRHRIGLSKKYNYRTTGIKASYKYKSRGKEYGENWIEIRKVIYRRDNYTCQECHIHCQVSGKKKIQCHHIDYDEKNNSPRNLITLCASCHGKTNGNRGYWTERFKEKTRSFEIMLDIMDKDGNIVAVLLDNGQVLKKEKLTDDQRKLIKDKVSKEKERK